MESTTPHILIEPAGGQPVFSIISRLSDWDEPQRQLFGGVPDDTSPAADGQDREVRILIGNYAPTAFSMLFEPGLLREVTRTFQAWNGEPKIVPLSMPQFRAICRNIAANGLGALAAQLRAGREIPVRYRVGLDE